MVKENINDFFTKFFIRLNLKSLMKKQIDAYYHDITEKTKKLEIDYLLLINPETIDSEKIQKIKEFHPNIKVYVYMWDSTKNKKKSLELLKNSDKFFAFDLEDKKINKDIKFLPLFYINDYKDIDKNDISYNSMNKDEILNIVAKSKIIVDIQHPLQTGLTMRTIEMIGSKKN